MKNTNTGNNMIRRKADIYMQYKYDFLNEDKELKSCSRKFNETMNRLGEAKDVFYTADEDGKLPAVTGRNKNALLGCYKNAMDRGNELLRTALKKGLGSVTAFYHSVETTMKMLTADAESLHAAAPGTLPELTAASKMQTIELDGDYDTAHLPVKIKMDTEKGTRVTAGTFCEGDITGKGTAMNAVAELLGMQEIITGTVPMEIRTAAGTRTGVFTESPKGSDPVQAAGNDPLLQVTGRAMNDSFTAIRKIADLQVLDFICGEKRERNMFLQAENGMLTGIQGADTGTAFAGNDSLNFSDALRNMRFINEETSVVIRDLSPEMLNFALSCSGLGKKEISGACERLNFLKNALDDRFVRSENPEKFPENPVTAADRLDGKKLYILNKEQTSILKMDHLSCFDSENYEPVNLFGHITQNMKSLRKRFLKGLCKDNTSEKSSAPADGISAENWKKILIEYRRQAGRFCGTILAEQEKTSMLPEKITEAIAALPGNISDLPASARGFEQMKKQLSDIAKNVSSCLKTAVPGQENLNMIMALHEMINLSEKAAEGICSPAFRAKDRIAQRILTVLAEGKNTQVLSHMNDHEQYNNAINNIERGHDFDVLTAGKSADTMDLLLNSPRTDFISCCKKAMKTTPAVTMEIPQVRNRICSEKMREPVK